VERCRPQILISINYVHEAESSLRNRWSLNWPKKIPAFYGARSFITSYIRTTTGPYPEPSPIHTFRSYFFKIHFNIILPSMPISRTSWVVFMNFSSPHTCYVSRPHPPTCTALFRLYTIYQGWKGYYEGVSKSFRTGCLERELQMIKLSATRCSCIAILWISLVSFAAINLCVASERVIPEVRVIYLLSPETFGYMPERETNQPAARKRLTLLPVSLKHGGNYRVFLTNYFIRLRA
jgi:hypothetical protein